MEQSREILFKFWKYDAFRPLQEDIVDTAIYGKDVLALLPTGGGKSVCFQVPGLAREGICIVISPLIALMEDQVLQLQKRGIRAKAITSAMTYREIDITLDNARFGGIEFLYVSPERLKTKLFIERFKLMKVGLIVVDEAHCISEWGHDFRPPYKDIHELREHHPNVPIMAVTATATEQVKQDIIKQLKLRNPEVFEAPFVRENISYEVYKVPNKFKAIQRVLTSFPNQTGIIYCQTRKSVKQLAQHFLALNEKVGIYHGGMDAFSRSQMLKAWLNDDLRIMVATNAFGMGIDKPDVRFVAHYEFPNNPEALFQEAGRAGRDGFPARTFVFYNGTEFDEMDGQIAIQFPPLEVIKSTYQLLCNFLKIAIGSGKGETYPFDIRAFVDVYKQDYLNVYHSLKFLELNGYLTFSESVYHPTKVKFAVNNATLYGFQLQNDSFVPLTTYLARNFPGVFDEYMDIQESNALSRLKINGQELEKKLKYLEQHGILDISWKTDLPLVTFIEERLPLENLRIDSELYQVRREVVQNRWKVMKEYVTETTVCRSQFLINYFGQNVPKCGKCDVCKNQSKTFDSTKATEIILNLAQKETSIDEIYTNFDLNNRNDVVALIQFLIKEERIFEHSGIIKLNK
ncbi:MAG TPA: ATP-dependent DNA helicase RecQ [Crocinitomicaceae bacterium]|nr:ATP-dependent DNA helicase RecQ [Crocinitomicaceae bacterium]